MFTYHVPTKIIAGKNAVTDNESVFTQYRRAFIVTGRRSGTASGALQDVCDIFLKNGIQFVIYDEVENNPSVECAYSAGLAAGKFGADVIIGIGGGSPMDTAKATAVYAVNTMRPLEIYAGNFKRKPLPIIAIPTTCGTGSEVTQYSILTVKEENTKKSFSCVDCFPKYAFLDGRYVMPLPLQSKRNTAVDALSHAVESIVNSRTTPASEHNAYEALKILGHNLFLLQTGNLDENDCSELLWASTLAGMAIAQTGTTIVHSMGYQLTYWRHIPHGMANGLLLGTFLEWCVERDAGAAETIDRIVKTLGMSRLDELSGALYALLPIDAHFSEKEFDLWTETAIQARNVKTAILPVTAEDEMQIYRRALGDR